MASAVASIAAASSTAITCQATASSRNVSARSGFMGATLRVSPAARAVRAEKLAVRASSSEELGGTQKQILEAFSGVKAKWDTVENKPTVLLYTGGAVLALWITSAVMGAIDSLPLVPDFLKLVGTVYGGWFVYRYLLFELYHTLRVNRLLPSAQPACCLARALLAPPARALPEPCALTACAARALPAPPARCL
ncbi:unnamed protein product [Closterium sp. Naga37s-1]|nr:unnamed protein product [Closterium sp. Naga37s-1]